MLKPIKDIAELDEKFDRNLSAFNPMFHEIECECGNKYLPFDLGGTKIDPGRCEDCVKEKVKKEDEEVVKRANNFLAEVEFKQFDVHCIIPPGCEDATFDNYEPNHETQETALNKAKEFTKNIDLDSNHSLMFQGTPGIGKSHLSVAIHKALREQFVSTLIIDAPSFFTKLKSLFGYSDSQEAQDRIMRAINKVDVLILDDIGAEYVKNNDGQETWASDILYQIMNARQTKVNVFSTNYKSADLKQKYGSLSSRIISRMLAGAEVIKIEGQDQRMRGFE